MLVGSAPVAFAQGGMTDRNYNSTGSQGVGNGGGMRAAPGEHATTGSTAGMRSTRRSRTESTRGETAHHATRKGAATGQEQR
jgi:hypothetical protein